MNVNGTGLRRLTHGDLGVDGNPTWSPDGTTIAFERTGSPNPIWLVDAGGTNERQLTTPPGEGPYGELLSGGDTHPDWSPDGDWIAFSRETEMYMSDTGSDRGRDDIYVIRPDGTDALRLTRRARQATGDDDHRWPTWSPDGKRIVFSVTARARTCSTST
jgi:TolB protein